MLVTIEIADKYMDCLIPKLVIQPFIENSAFHAFYGKNMENPSICIAAADLDEKLIISIIDNGKGIEPDKLSQIQNGLTDGEQNFAISNVDKRIKHLYGEDFGVEIESQIHVGTKICLILPLIWSEQSISEESENEIDC